MADNKFEKALALKLRADEFEDLTIKQYLFNLLTTLWREGESFSGKRPFGNSGWEYDLYHPLVEAGLIKGRIDSDGYLDECDTKQGWKFVNKLIGYLENK